MFKIFSKINKKPFIITKEFAQEILKRNSSPEEMKQNTQENVKGKVKVKKL